MFGQPPVNQYGSAGAYYGGAESPATMLGDAIPQLQKGSFLRGQRRRLNACPLLLNLLVPWALFTVMYVVMSFELHYEEPSLCNAIVALGFLASAGVGALAVSTRVKWHSNAEHEPTWLFFLALSMFLAWIVGMSMGGTNYAAHMRPYFDMNNLNEYGNVSVKMMRGQQLMDAGIMEFMNGTKLDITKSMGFKSNTVYCVAPIVLGTEKLPTYDFWAVGTGCCSGSQADFHCQGWNAPGAHGGLRLMADSSRAFYRLAVQQAEAAYKIKAVHPLFFSWVADAHSTVESWRHTGKSNCVMWVIAYFVFQSFLVAVATFVFAKLGHL